MSSNRSPKKWHGMCIVATYKPEEILPLRGDHEATFYAGDFPYSVHMDSLRYAVFAKSLTCCECGILGVEMRLEYSYNKDGHFRPHFNLYAHRPDGSLVLMTKDHIIPKSKGGDNTEENLRTMCAPCNEKKGAFLDSPQAAKHREKQRSTLLNYLRGVIDNGGSREVAEALLLSLLDDPKLTSRWQQASAKWSENAQAG